MLVLQPSIRRPVIGLLVVMSCSLGLRREALCQVIIDDFTTPQILSIPPGSGDEATRQITIGGTTVDRTFSLTLQGGTEGVSLESLPSPPDPNYLSWQNGATTLSTGKIIYDYNIDGSDATIDLIDDRTGVTFEISRLVNDLTFDLNIAIASNGEIRTYSESIAANSPAGIPVSIPLTDFGPPGADLSFFEFVDRIEIQFQSTVGDTDVTIGRLPQGEYLPINGLIQTNGQAIPEPSTFGLLFVALCVAGFYRKVHRRN